ncbi:Tox-REase-5 domain-containing protein [Streptomyces sp. NPDC051080]|uniref:Tox-REase-5 domain-containing protein n=1 Tax=Streptomyces sp. NPDC051080 TaxID=3157222 RepID=UPI003419790A
MLILVRLLFAAAVVGGVGVMTVASAVDEVDGQLFGLLLYAALPSVIGFVLSLYARTGGVWVWRGLLAVHVWLTLGALATLGGAGGGRGVTQLVMPVAVVVLLFRASSREWFDLPLGQRLPHRRFSIARMIKWRRDDAGQTAMEYLGMVLVVVALIGGLVVTGIGAQLTGGLQDAICRLTGSACPAPGSNVEAGPGTDSGGSTTSGGKDAGGADAGGTHTGGTDTGGSVATGGTDSGGSGPAGSGSGSGGTDTAGGTGSAGSAGNGSAGNGSGGNGSGGSGGDDVVQVDDGGDDVDTSGEPDGGDDQDDGTGGDEEKSDESCTSGVGAFFSCAAHQTGGFFKGLVGDGLWGDVTGTIDTIFHPIKAWDGLMDYGKSLGDKWSQDSKGAGDKWSDGDYLGAVWDWTKASGGTGVKVLDDMFIGDEVRDMWKEGNEGQAIGTGLWNIGSLFIPGYGEAKLVGKVGKLGKFGKLGKLGEFAEKAGEAANKAKKAAKAGDITAAEKAAKEAQQHADDAAEQAGLKGCTVGMGGRLRVPYGSGAGLGLPGSGTGVLAGARTSVPLGFLAGKCDEVDPEKKAAADEAQRLADEAKKAADAAKRRKALEDAKNQPKPEWYKDLKDPPAGAKDGGEGNWQEIKPGVWNYPTEMGARYQEQISKVGRGKEYRVPLDKLTGKPVDFDGWDASRGTYLEAKYGYKGKDFYNADTGTLTPKVADRWADQASRQVDAARGKPVEWHLSDPDVAEAAREMFEERGIPVKVIHTPGDVTG